MGKNETITRTMKQLLLQIEIEAGNTNETVGNRASKSRQEETFSLQSLMNALEETFGQSNKKQFSKQKENVCVFWEGKHYSDECSRVKNVDDRREILKRSSYCFKLMKPGYSKANFK